MLGEIWIAAMPTKCMMQMPAARMTGAMSWTLRPSARARPRASAAAGGAEHHSHAGQDRVPGDQAGDPQARHRGEVHADRGEPDDAAADEAGGARPVGRDRHADGRQDDGDEEGAARERRVVADADARLKGEQRDEMGGPHHGAGGKARKEQPAAAALAVHLARLREEEQGDEAAERTDRSGEENELGVVALQDFVGRR